jgi:hypothetical protein
MMDCTRQAKVKPYYREMSTLGSGRAKGWACGVAEKGSDWLGSSTGPHTKGSVDEVMTWLVTRIRSPMGKAAHLCRVKDVACHSLFREGTTNAAGKELHEVLVNL